MLNNNHFSPNAISHKELSTLMNKARKEISSIDSTEIDENNENKEFTDLVTTWTQTSQKILLML